MIENVVGNTNLNNGGSNEFNFNRTNNVTANIVKIDQDYLDYCDESKCVSSLLLGRIGDSGNNNDLVPTFMCYAEGSAFSPFACAEGYKGFVIDNEPSFLYDGRNLSYYTCCFHVPIPAQYLLSNSSSSIKNTSSSSISLTHQRHCSNTVVIGNNEEEGGGQTTNLCNSSVSKFDSIKKKEYQRNMTKSYGHLSSYMCCDESLLPPSSLNNNITLIFNYRDNNVDCVPYLCSDIFDYDCISKNRYGVLEAISCKDDIYDGIFTFPKIVETNDNDVRFECCKTGTKTHILAKSTYAFKSTICVQLALSSIAFVFLLILIMGLLKPFVVKGLKWICGKMSSQQDHQQQQQQYVSYNLYLLFIAIPDLVYSVFLVWRCSSALTGQTFDNKWAILDWNGTTDIVYYSTYILIICVTANVWMNAVIAFEVFKFLKNSFELIRDPAPTLLRVSLQAVGVYVYSIILSTIFVIILPKYYYSEGSSYEIIICSAVLSLFAIIGPFIFLISICILIWKRAYIKRTDHQYKHLAIYFLRIVVVFILFWIPNTVLAMIYTFFAVDGNESLPPFVAIALILVSLQAIVSVIMALLKPDVQKMVMDIFTGCCCCYKNNNQIEGLDNNHNNTSETAQGLDPSMFLDENEKDKEDNNDNRQKN